METILQETDHFDRLPDAIILDIFNKLLDAKTLTRCLVVCKRFSSLVPQINNVSLSIIPRPHRRREPPTSKRSYLRIVFRKLKFFRRFMAASKPSSAVNKDSTVSYPVLNKFSEIKFMNIQFPFYGNGIGSLEADDCLIKWKAEFGRGLRSCVILGATSFQEMNPAWDNSDDRGDEFLTDDQLKLRIIWTISCLISSSARHHFLKQIVSDHPNLQSVVVNDCKNQGKLSMDEEQLLEMRKSMDENSLERTPLPDLSIKMLYSPVLELPASGYTMRGATLVMIRAVDDDGLVMKKESDGGGGDLLGGWLDGDGEDKAFGEAVREIMKVKKSYVMTMNSF